jgi:predicted component of type VI protein secretion system
MANLYFMMREPGQADQALVWDTRTLSIGRAPENDLVLDHDEISRNHALLSNEGGAMVIQDYRTGNGTFVNSQRVEGKMKIQPGVLIGVGKTQLELRVSDEHPAKLGHKLIYASQLKTMGMLPAGADDGDRTMLGMMDTQPGDDLFVVEPARSTGAGAFVAGSEEQPEFQMLQLDEGLGGPALDLDESLELDDGLDLVDPIGLEMAAPVAAAPVAAAPAPVAQGATTQTDFDPMERMRKLKALHDAGLITDEEFGAKRAEVLSQV